MNGIGRRIKELRIKHRMTQQELGELLGVQKSAIQKYESGAVVNLRADKIRLLCKIFRVYPRYFIFDSDDEFWKYVFDGHKSTDGAITDKVITKLIEDHVGINTLKIMITLNGLNKTGQKKVVDYIFDIFKIEEYLLEKKKDGE